MQENSGRAQGMRSRRARADIAGVADQPWQNASSYRTSGHKDGPAHSQPPAGRSTPKPPCRHTAPGRGLDNPQRPTSTKNGQIRPNPAKMTTISEIRPHRSRLSAVFDRLGLIIPRISIKHSGGGTRQQSRFRRKEGSAKSGDQTTIVLRGSGY